MSELRVRDRGEAIDRGFSLVQKWGLRLIVIAVALYVTGWFIGQTWMIWFPVSIATLFATVLGQPATWLRSKGVPAALAAAAVMLGFLAFLTAVFSVLIPQLVEEAPEIAAQAADGLDQVQEWLIEGPLKIDATQINNALDSLQTWLKSSALDISTGVLSTIGTAVGFVVNFVLILILTFLFVKDGHRFLPFVERLGGQRAGGHLREVLSRAWGTLGNFIRTQALVSLIDAVLIGLGLVIVGVPLWAPLAILTFFGGFIPIVGAFASGALAVLVTLVTNDPKDALIILLVVVAVQQLEGNVLSPILQGKGMNLHPAIVLLSVTAGGSMFGITGAFLAVPVAASVAEVLRYINEHIDREVAGSSDDPSTADAAAELDAPAEPG